MANEFKVYIQNIINSIPFGILIVDEFESIVHSNTRAVELLSLSPLQLSNQKFSELFHNSHYLSYVRNTKQSLLNQSLKWNGKQLLASFTLLDIPGKRKEVVCTLNEGSDLEQVFEQLNNVERLNLELETIINSSFDEIFVTNGEGTVLRVNPAGERLYGMKAEEIIGKNANHLGEEGLYSPALYPIVKDRKEMVSMIQRTKTGKIVHVIANPAFDEEGNISIIIFTSRDLTEIRHLKEKIERTQFLLETYQTELEELRSFHEQPVDIIAFSPNMRKITKMVQKIASVDSTVLITGESGVGKGVIAHNIHKMSTRREAPFIHINCGAIPETLIESELFGYEGGAFTGAKKDGHIGLIEQANGGTLFLDEIGEMPLNLQVKLLKALQDRKINRVGSSKTIEIDARIIAATNKDLEKMVSEGSFREDLYYRLNVIPIHIPPLRTRPEDISYLIDYFLKKHCEKHKMVKQFSLEVENLLIQYDWPGNVRELENLIERLIVTSEEDLITREDIPRHIMNKAIENNSGILLNRICTLKQAQEEVEEQLIRKAYDLYKSSYKIAEVLGINQSTAIRKIQKYVKNRS